MESSRASTAESGVEPAAAAESGAEPAAAAESGAEPAAESGAEPAAESGAEPAAESGAEPASTNDAAPVFDYPKGELAVVDTSAELVELEDRTRIDWAVEVVGFSTIIDAGVEESNVEMQWSVVNPEGFDEVPEESKVQVFHKATRGRTHFIRFKTYLAFAPERPAGEYLSTFVIRDHIGKQQTQATKVVKLFPR